MGYCFTLYTPDMKKQDSGKFIACEKLLFSNEVSSNYVSFIVNNAIGYYEQYIGGKGKYLDIYNSVFVLNENQCEKADKYTKSTFFTDFIKEHNCNGMFIRIT